MKLKNIILILILVGIGIQQVIAQDQSPTVENVMFSQRTDGTFLVDIYYNVNDPEGSAMTVTMQVSSDNGVTWDFDCDSITGDVGANITNGTSKHIEWNFGSEHPETFGDQFRIKIIADDVVIVMGVPCPDMPKVYYEGGPNNDIAGDYYNTVLIGDQCWLKENLNVGSMIPVSQNQGINESVMKYCYNNDSSNCEIFGGLYQWWTAIWGFTGGANIQGICPPGWHIPTLGEFQLLATSVNYDGNALKREDQGIGSGSGTNISGFSALLSGKSTGSDFSDLFNLSCFWTSDAYDPIWSYRLFLYNASSLISIQFEDVDYGFSVRCVKD